MKIFTLQNHGSLIKIKCMCDSQRYLETALARTIDSHTGYMNAYDVADKNHQNEIKEMMRLLGIIYFVTRHNSKSWVKESWLKEVLKLTATKMKRYIHILEHGIKYKGAGGYIREGKDNNGETWYQIDNFDDYNNNYNPQYYLDFLRASNQLQSGFPTMFVAEFENKVDKYHDTGIKKNITLNDIGMFSVHDIDNEFENTLRAIDDKLFPVPVDASAINKCETIYDNATALF